MERILPLAQSTNDDGHTEEEPLSKLVRKRKQEMKTIPLFFTVASGGTTTFINAAHVVKIEIEAVKRESGTLYLADGSTVELNANSADFIMRLMAIGAHEQMQALGDFKKLTGER